MAVPTIKERICKDIHTVWEAVFAVDHYGAWRSDLKKAEVINEKQFVEYAKNEYATTFTVTDIEP